MYYKNQSVILRNKDKVTIAIVVDRSGDSYAVIAKDGSNINIREVSDEERLDFIFSDNNENTFRHIYLGDYFEPSILKPEQIYKDNIPERVSSFIKGGTKKNILEYLSVVEVKINKKEYFIKKYNK